MLTFFDIRKGEGRKTLQMFLYFFLTIMVLYVLKPVRSSLFLEELGSRNLRYVYLGEGVFLLFLTWAYVQLAKRLPKRILFLSTLLFFISNLVIFWWLFHIRVPYLSALFYIWVACFSITSVTQFWTLANDIFDPLEAKRLFGVIISGGSAGGVLGGLFTNQAVQWMRTEDLLICSAFLLAGCVFLIIPVCGYLPPPSLKSAETESSGGRNSARKIFFRSPYLWMIAGLVLLPKIASTVVDNQFNAAVEASLLGKEAKTAFFGGFSAGLNIVSFLMQLYATSLSLRFLGIGISLTLLPMGVGLASLVTFIYPVLWTATSLKVFDGSMNYSIQQASKELLYLPLSSEVRYRVKPVIDMLIYRISKTAGGLLIILLAPLFAVPNERVGVLVLFLIPFWILLVSKTRSAYLHLLRENLWKEAESKRLRKTRPTSNVLSLLSDEKSFDQLHSLLTEHSSMGRKLAAAACLAYHRSGGDLEAARRLVNDMIRWEALEFVFDKEERTKNSIEEKEFLDGLLLHQAAKEAGSEKSEAVTSAKRPETILRQVFSILQDPKQSMALKRKAALYLEQVASPAVAGRLLEILTHTQAHALRFLLLQTLIHMKEKHPMLRLSRSLVKKEILRETQLYWKLKKLQNFYLQNQERKEKFLETALGAICQESLERIFRCLALIYRGDGLRLIYDCLVDPNGSESTRSHAMELLHNLLEPEFYVILEPILEKTAQAASEEEAAEILEEIAASPDRWLSLTAHFLVMELGWQSRSPRFASLVSGQFFEPLDV